MKGGAARARAMKLRVLIVDDERPARAKLRHFLKDEPEVGTIHEAWDGASALAVIRDFAPDLVFLDIRMPGLSGLDVMEALPAERAPHVVFVTADDAHALRAFELAAVDYLLKPWDEDRFRTAFRRAREALSARRAADEAARIRELLATLGHSADPSLDHVAADVDGRRALIPVGKIEWLEADRNHVVVHARTVRGRMRGTLSELLPRLDPKRFRRTGRSTAVNLDAVTHLESTGHGDRLVHLRSGASVRLSRRYRWDRGAGGVEGVEDGRG